MQKYCKIKHFPETPLHPTQHIKTLQARIFPNQDKKKVDKSYFDLSTE